MFKSGFTIKNSPWDKVFYLQILTWKEKLPSEYK